MEKYILGRLVLKAVTPSPKKKKSVSLTVPQYIAKVF
jgi:hypothetical protein